MQSVLSLISELEALDVRLRIEEGKLRYSAPKGVLDKQWLDRIVANKSALMELLAQRTAVIAVDPESDAPIARQSRDQGLPLSSAQQRFWFLDQLDYGNSAAFVVPPMTLRLHGPLHVEALRDALVALIERHEVLRSAFRIEGKEPVQVALNLAKGHSTLRLEDITNQAPEQQAQHVRELIRHEALTPFDLQRGDVLMRARLLELAANEHVLILTMHHIIADGWSMGILVDELSHLYRALAADPACDPAGVLPPLPIQYADYAHWERRRLSGTRFERLRSYWLQQLSGAPEVLPLPTDLHRPRVRSNRGAAEHFQLDADLSARLVQLAREAAVTPFMLLLAAFGVLLCRYTDREDIVIGSPTGARPHPQTEGLIGLFLNTLALRLDLSGNPGFHELLARVRGVALGAFEHGDMPFEQILQALDLQRNLDHTPLFQVLFALQNAPLGEVTLEGLRITPEPMESLHAPFDLVLSLEETANGIKGFFRYNTDLFVASTVQRMVGHYQRLLRSLLAAPDCGIRQLSYIGSDEIAQLRQWRGGVGHFDASIPLHQRFQAIAATRPDACAVRFGEQTLSYGQLERRSNQLAAHLRRLGVQRGDRVGLCTERSLELVIGILGILKCGSAYVPLDPAYPEDRQRYMAEDSALQVVVVLGALPPLRASLVDLADAQWQTEDDAAVIDASTPTDVAYVIYTSGSTGRPKGVEVTHANVVRLFTATESLFGFGPCDVWTLFHSYAFDFSVWELWGALLYGGRLVVVPYAISRSPDQFLSLLADAGVTVLNQTPSAFRQLIEADRRLQAEAAPALALKWVIFGGEALDPRSLQNWVQRRGLEAPQLINMYGITETTVHVTYQRLTTADISAGGSVIGRALPDLSIELVDRYGQAVPIGVAGEIWVGGAGLAKGYLNQPELTAQRFVNQPSLLDQAMPVRQYRSGDLARWRADGRLDYLGRIDLQVKIRGFRIELGEIESCLAAIPGVSEAFVEARQEAVGARLIAYVVTAAWQDPALPSALRAQLRQQLPDYMVPTALHPLERFPLTSNGKLDRKQLAALVEQRAAAAAQDEAVTALAAPPQTELEFLLAELWREALGIHQVGLDDNFFELGGDSIRGAILINQLQEQIRSVVHVVALFEAPTIRQFVEFLQVNYPDAVARLGGQTLVQEDDTATALIDEAAIARFRALIPPLPAYVPKPLAPKNPRAIFVLSPPRSGSTLLRVLLGGHPALFSPPELELLGFEALGERRRVCSGRDAFWLEGTLRAVMQALQVDADTAKDLMAEREDADMGVKEFYGELQSWLGGKILVDKSPSYALDVGVMQRAEAYFERPLYLHLHRHPYGMISSFEEARLNQIFFRYPHDLKVRELAELIWLQSHRNIVEFLATIPPERQMAISFEDITRQPEASTRHLCDFMGIAFTPEMLEIYGGERKQQRMTDGIYRESKMLGDIKFHTHQKIDPGVAERWRKIYRTDFLGDASWQMAQTLGYVRTAPDGVMPILPLSAHVRSAALPLSLAQQRLWFLDQLEGAGSAYHMPVALRLYGSLNEAALLQSLHHIVQRHEGLRAFFTTQGDEPAVMLREPWTPVVVEDLSSLAGDEHEAEMLRRVREEATQPFDLARGPLFRSRLLRLDAQQHVIVVNMHHIVSDGWSLGILVAEWGKLYNALAAGTDAQLPALPVQYADYAQWQRSYLSGERLQRQLDYWRGRMAGAPALLELPTDRPRPAIQTFAGCSLAFALDNTLATALRRFADEAQVSLYMLLLAAFGILLSRYSGQTDIVIGSPTANRSRKEIEGLIGFFMNTIVMRLAVDPVQRFDDYLAQVRQLALQAYAHQDVSFEQLVEKLRPQRNLSYSPLFQVMFSLQSAPATIPALTGLEVKEITLQQPIAKYDLTLAITDRNGVLNGMFEFATDLFDAATIERMAANFQTLLGNIVAASPGTLAQLPLLSNPERQLLLTDWNATQKVHGGCATLHGLFEAQVARTPTAIAVQARDGRLSYTELDARAEAVANRLRACGVGSGGMVGLCLRRTLDLPVALLAILKTGNAYVPLDPDYPAERIRYVLQDAAVGVLLTQTVLADALSSADYAVVCVDAPQTDAAVRMAPADREKIASSKAALAYVIYTSGSTGRPKGVMISHLAAVNFIESMQREPGMTAHDTLLAVTTISFDIAVLELYLPLSVGARIVLADEAMTRDAAALMQTLIDEHITLMQATPATWRLLLAAGWAGAPQLKILCGGEALPTSLGEVLLGRCASLWNMYGPTETTVWSTLRRVDPDDTARATVPIGHPIGNTRIYILDALQQPQPIGVSGELFIAGEGVAEGYLGRPDLTAERFLVDPFMLGGRMYWTGDRARYLADGRIEFLGRGDQQIKVRGYRVELGEIEHVLAQQPGVTVCAIGLDQNSQGEARLVAYYVGAQADRQMLRQALRDVLPDYMVPSLFVALEQLPLTPNGKIDRKALRVPDDALRVDVNERVLPRDATELVLSRIWEEVLHVTPIGIHDNFFDLGGHSLVAVRLMARVAQQFGRTLPLASLFQAASVAAMARLLRDPNAPYTGSSLVTVRQGPMEQSLYCVAGAGGNVVYLNELAAAWAPHGAFFALQPPGLDGHTPILESVEELAAHYIKTIVNEQGEAPRRLAGHSFGGLVAFEMARQLIAADEPVEALILLDTPAPQYFEPTGRDWSDAQWLAQVSQIASHMYGVETGFHVEELSTLPVAQQFACVHARLIATGVLPEGTPLEFFRGFVDVYKANLRARYEVSVTNPIPDFPRTLLLRSANEQPEHLVAATAQPVRASDDFGWNPYLPEPVRSVVVPGDHLTMLHTPATTAVAAAITDFLLAGRMHPT